MTVGGADAAIVAVESGAVRFTMPSLDREATPGSEHPVVVTVDGRDTAFALPDLATAAVSDAGQVDVDASGQPFRISFRVVPGTASVKPLGDPNRLQAVRHTFWFAWYSLGGMIPDTDEFLTSNCTIRPPIPSPGGA